MSKVILNEFVPIIEEGDKRHNNRQRYKHDCDHCKYLGRIIMGLGGGDFDLYSHIDREITVIARYSDDGPDYKSGLVFAAASFGNASVNPLRAAYLLDYEAINEATAKRREERHDR